MATVTRDSKGARVWFKDGTGKRKSIRLGDVTMTTQPALR